MSNYTVKPMVPLRTAQELKDATIRDYKRAAERIGSPVETRAIEQLVKSDLELVDAVKRGVDLSPRPKQKKPRESRAEKLIMTPQEAANAPKLKAAPRTRARPGVLYAQAQKVSARWPYAMGRLKRIVEGASKATTNEGVTSTCECPDLALEIRRLHAEYILRNRQSKWNRFAGLSEIDAQRKMQRAVEDICDRSTSKLGPWWVPK
jgi:hypothetical protein